MGQGNPQILDVAVVLGGRRPQPVQWPQGVSDEADCHLIPLAHSIPAHSTHFCAVCSDLDMQSSHAAVALPGLEDDVLAEGYSNLLASARSESSEHLIYMYLWHGGRECLVTSRVF